MMNDREFVGARLELARAFHQMTLKQLAEAMSVSVSVLGYYESGQRKQPADDVVAALAQVLRVKPDFFYKSLPDMWRESECSFRRRAATPENVKKRARAHGTFIGLVMRELTSLVKAPTYNVPSGRAGSFEEIERSAELCREQWKLGLGPIEHIGRIAERNGVVLVQHLRHTDKIDAFARRGEFSVIVMNVARTSRSRWIFDVAHELGHFVLHDGIETGSKDTENQANYFAGALLLPRKTFSREFRARPFSWTHAFDLKRRWLTSVAAIVRRAFNLGLIDPLTYRRCFRHMSAQGWLTHGEPHEPAFAGPEWMTSAFALAEKRFKVTPKALCERLDMLPETFMAVTGIRLQNTDPVAFTPRAVRA